MSLPHADYNIKTCDGIQVLSKSIFMASNFFMQMFNVSTLCIQSIKMFQ